MNKHLGSITKLFLLGFMILQSYAYNFSFAQDNLVSYSPFVKNNSQYMVINPSEIPDAVTFELVINKLHLEVAEDGDSSYMFLPEWGGNFDLDQPFIKIPENYTEKRNREYNYFINAFDNEQKLILSTPLFEEHSAIILADVPTPGDTIICSSDCNGPDYAYTINHHQTTVNNGSKYKLVVNRAVNTTSTGVEMKYYQYMGANQFQLWTYNQSVNWQNKVLNYPDVNLLPQHTANGTNISYYTSQNSVITDFPVYAIEKDKGQWENSNINAVLSLPLYANANQSNWKLNSNFVCDNNTVFNQVNAINNDNDVQDLFSIYNVDELQCHMVGVNGQLTGGGSGGSGSGSIGDLEESQNLQFVNCFRNILTNNGSNEHDIPWNWQNISFFDCVTYGYSGPDLDYDPSSSIYSLSFSKVIPGETQEHVSILPHQIVDSNNAFVGYDYSLSAGLYKINLVFNDLTIVEFLAYKVESSNYTHKQSDVFNVVIHPNPLDENYDLTMSSNYNLGDINYRVYSPQQELLYETDFNGSFDEGVNKVEPIGLDAIGNNHSYLIHLFTFSDGSTTRITTLTK